MSDNYRSREERRRAMNDNKPEGKSQGKPKKKKKGGLFRKIVAAVLLIGIIGLIAGVGTFFAMISDAPKVDDSVLKNSFSSKVYANDGKTVVKEIGAQKRTYVQYDEIPQVVKNAFIATEDVRFYKHHGVDFYRIGGALMANFKNGFGAEGGSTITQQVVKNSFLSPKKTVKRKVQEMWLAYQLERKYSKQQILEMYLNKIYFASGEVYGIERAAEKFYGVKSVKDLTLDEAAMLAGLPKAPTTYNPVTNPENATKRRNTVLNLMAKNGFITQAEADKAKQVDVQAHLAKQTESTSKYDVFIDQVIEEVKKKTDADPFSAGLEIYTTLDTNAQDYVDDVMNNKVVNFPNDKFQAGLVVVDNETGGIQAIGGGRNRVSGGLNFATNMRRQPGSTIKPILDYGPAIENLKWSTGQPIKDEEYHYSNGTPIRNFGRNYKGWVSAREALGRSLNIPALKAFQATGADKAKEFATGLGLKLDEEDGEAYSESYSIGGFRTGVTPLQMAGAYSAFANEGMYNAPHTVTKVKFPDGTEIDLTPKPKRAMQDYTAFMMTDMMKSVVNESYGTARAVRTPGLEIAGKTGTSNFSAAEKQRYNIPDAGEKDVWFNGFTPNYTISVWTGYETAKDGYILSPNETGMAKNIFKHVITHISEGKPKGSFKQPDSVVERSVEKPTGKDLKRPSGSTPSSLITKEYFVRGTAPTKVSQTFVKKEKEEKKEDKKEDKKEKKDNKDNKDVKPKITASYSGGAISVNWSASNAASDTTFTVTMSSPNGSEQLASGAGAGGKTISNPAPGATYSFTVTTNTGQSASSSVKVPDSSDQATEDDSTKPEDDGTTDDNQNEDNSNTDQNNGSDQGDDSSTQPDDNQNSNNGNNGSNSGGSNSGNTDNNNNDSGNANEGNNGNNNNNGGTTPPPADNGGSDSGSQTPQTPATPSTPSTSATPQQEPTTEN
ncbi:PBP1A family penicillin-binding protein [Priestia sp. SIMBA_032]|uniref:PBP1A family penicillin-binding protein n=1 Tax=Priestia TaxID=2800373 RepID=UPI0039783A75